MSSFTASWLASRSSTTAIHSSNLDRVSSQSLYFSSTACYTRNKIISKPSYTCSLLIYSALTKSSIVHLFYGAILQCILNYSVFLNAEYF